MIAAYGKAFVVFVFMAVTGVASGLIATTTDAHKQAIKQITALVTGELAVPGTRGVLRIEDPEYKVICYIIRGTGSMACLKR
jgi:hypothetical protein